MKLKDLESIFLENLKDKTIEFKRVFHGRGNFYDDFDYLTIDSIDEIFFVCLFKETLLENRIISFLNNFAKQNNFKTFIVQRRYLKNAPSQIVFGKINKIEIAVENGLKYLINFSNKNIGFFPDMKRGREFIRSIAKDKKVLNLFSYSCAFSVCAIKAGAKQVVNVDMAKGALTIGRENHHLNSLDTKRVKFLPYNILKSWSRIKKDSPYDIIIIDPPSFQKGSFEATKDYEKIIKRLDSLASKNCIVLSCLNAPELNIDFIKNLFKKNAPTFKFVKRLDNLNTFPTSNESKALKNLVFKKNKI